jgi:hypothetical protein
MWHASLKTPVVMKTGISYRNHESCVTSSSKFQTALAEIGDKKSDDKIKGKIISIK